MFTFYFTFYIYIYICKYDLTKYNLFVIKVSLISPRILAVPAPGCFSINVCEWMKEWMNQYSLFQMSEIVWWNSLCDGSSNLVLISSRAKLPLNRHTNKIQNPTICILKCISLLYIWNLKVTANNQQLNCLKENTVYPFINI